MYREKQIALVIPAYREEKLIQSTLERVPALFDRVFVVDDASPDQQANKVREYSLKDKRVTLLSHQTNQGPGGAIITGYKTSAYVGMDLVVVVGGDNQMDLSEVEHFLDPIIDGEADYTKGNRFGSEQFLKTIRTMPKVRFFANWLITLITRVASGNFTLVDAVDGYTAIHRNAIVAIDWDKAWKRYGYPLDFLVRLSAYGFRIRNVSRTAIYLPNVRQSQINGLSYFLQVSPLLVKGFFWRLSFKPPPSVKTVYS